MSLLNFVIAAFFTLTFSLNTTAAASINALPNNTALEQVEGGPRTVIQAMTDVIVQQPTATTLYITIVNSEGDAVLETETEDTRTVISIAGFKSGEYTVETIDDYGDYQEFYITVK